MPVSSPDSLSTVPLGRDEAHIPLREVAGSLDSLATSVDPLGGAVPPIGVRSNVAAEDTLLQGDSRYTFEEALRVDSNVAAVPLVRGGLLAQIY